LNDIDDLNRNKKQTFSQAIIRKIKDFAQLFLDWLKPDPNDPWYLQTIKIVLKIPVVLFLIVCSPILLVVLVIVFLIAL
jgi:hypothetical protein